MARVRPGTLLGESKGSHSSFDDLSGDEREKDGQVATDEETEGGVLRNGVKRSRKEQRIKKKRRK